jgi:PilZ domain-containing protein
VLSRRFPRYPIDRPLKATVYWEDQPIRKLHGRALMVGEGGLGAWLTDQLYMGEVVRLEMPPIPPLYAMVRNTRGTQHGFEFLYSRDGQRRAITELCAAVAQEQS